MCHKATCEVPLDRTECGELVISELEPGFQFQECGLNLPAPEVAIDEQERSFQRAVAFARTEDERLTESSALEHDDGTRLRHLVFPCINDCLSNDPEQTFVRLHSLPMIEHLLHRSFLPVGKQRLSSSLLYPFLLHDEPYGHCDRDAHEELSAFRANGCEEEGVAEAFIHDDEHCLRPSQAPAKERDPCLEDGVPLSRIEDLEREGVLDARSRNDCGTKHLVARYRRLPAIVPDTGNGFGSAVLVVRRYRPVEDEDVRRTVMSCRTMTDNREAKPVDRGNIPLRSLEEVLESGERFLCLQGKLRLGTFREKEQRFDDGTEGTVRPRIEASGILRDALGKREMSVNDFHGGVGKVLKTSSMPPFDRMCNFLVQ